MTDQEPQRPKRERDQLWDIQRSVRYHGRRRAWFERWHFGTLLGVVLSAGGVAARLEALEGVSLLLSGLTGLLVALNIVGRFAERAALHQSLAARFRSLEKRFALARPMTDDEFERIVADRLNIESDEPPGKLLLNTLCHYEQWAGTRHDFVPVKVKWWRRWSAHLFSHADYDSTLPAIPGKQAAATAKKEAAPV